MTQVWILMQGEDFEGGHITGVYATPEDAREDFMEAAARIDATFTIDGALLKGGALTVHGGCDWLRLAPYDVLSKPPLPH
ncbi:hypothetical protein ACH4PU_32735 [Streptomyces sp. NPDC021100]|uniref:hypothetical protein n=1 Tax=Streptomyces sp. NPDC021100 TaxID=3365114 RepID=UPI0037BAD6F9